MRLLQRACMLVDGHFAARRRAWLSCIELCDKRCRDRGLPPSATCCRWPRRIRGSAYRHRPPVRGPGARLLGSYLKYTFASEDERARATHHADPDRVLAETALLDFLRV